MLFFTDGPFVYMKDQIITPEVSDTPEEFTLEWEDTLQHTGLELRETETLLDKTAIQL